ncbi:MAG: J domain-containing protein [Holophagaceae bacterium]|nr:J domain-containing protein [Holophagaceae bacterium]
MNPFEVLQVRPGASADEVKAAYHQLAKKWHPDKFSGAEKQAAEDKFRAISEAYSAIKSGTAQIQATDSASQHPAPTSHPKEKLPADWLSDAKKAFIEKQFDNALALSQYCFNYPEIAEEARLVYAKIIEATTKDVKTLARAYEDVMKINPNNGGAIARLAELYLALNMPTRAASMAAKAKSLGVTAAPRPHPSSETASPGAGAEGGSEGMIGKMFGFLKK